VLKKLILESKKKSEWTRWKEAKFVFAIAESDLSIGW